LLQHRLVELRIDVETVDAQGGTRLTANADGVDADSAIGGGLRGEERIGRLIVFAVGEEDNGRDSAKRMLSR